MREFKLFLFLSFSLVVLFCYFPIMQQTLWPTHSASLYLFFLPLLSHSCKQTEARNLKQGRQTNPSSISLSWLLIQGPDALSSSAKLCVCGLLGHSSRAQTHKLGDFVWKQSEKQLEPGTIQIICLETRQTLGCESRTAEGVAAAQTS